MPELPEVEVLVRHLEPLLKNKVIQTVIVRREKVVQPTPPPNLTQTLLGSKFLRVQRRGKYLVFTLRQPVARRDYQLLGHLGMTGRMYLAPVSQEPPKHVPVEMHLGKLKFVFEDTRYFGRLTLDLSPLDELGPEPFEALFTGEYLRQALKGCRQAIKVKLLDQSLVAGVGNIYASEALFDAGISPRKAGGRLTVNETRRLAKSIQKVLLKAIKFGSTVPLNLEGSKKRNGLFYYGTAEGASEYYQERLRVYDKAGQACPKCKTPIRRFVQANRSTYHCPRCQR